MKKTKKQTKAYLESSRKTLKMLFRERMKQQDTRKAMSNKIGIKADGKTQNLKIEIDPLHVMLLDEIKLNAKSNENLIEQQIKKIVEEFPIYNKWLKNVKGIGPVMAGAIIGFIDIEVADTVSKIQQYAGLNPQEVFGKKSVPKSKYKKSMGEKLFELPSFKDGEVRYCVQTNDKIKGDRATPGYLLPYNKQLRVVLCGILAGQFFKAKSPYRTNFYDPYKHRLENSQKITKEIKKGGKIVEIPWCECTKKHIHQAAVRFMIKGFLKDLYNEWRTIEGLPVRVPYEEEYLNKVHSSKDKNKSKPKTKSKKLPIAASSKKSSLLKMKFK